MCLEIVPEFPIARLIKTDVLLDHRRRPPSGLFTTFITNQPITLKIPHTYHGEFKQVLWGLSGIEGRFFGISAYQNMFGISPRA